MTWPEVGTGQSRGTFSGFSGIPRWVRPRLAVGVWTPQGCSCVWVEGSDCLLLTQRDL